MGRILAGGSALYADPRTLDVLGVRDVYRPSPSKGLPIGNLTSQLFANLVLDGLDHFAKRARKVPVYVRYLDDVVLFGDRKGEVRASAEACAEWAARERRLEVHTEGIRPVKTEGEHRFLGAVVSRAAIRPRAKTLKRMAARMRERARAAIDAGEPDAWIRELKANVAALRF